MNTPRRSASMTLLNDLMSKSMDTSYEQAHSQRQAAGESTPSRHWLSTMLVIMMSALVGLVVVWGISTLGQHDDAVPDARAVLATELNERRAIQAGLITQREQLTTEITNLQAAQLDPVGQELLRRSSELAIWNGTSAVTGPGVVVTIEDGPSSDPLVATNEDALVRDYDVQLVINSLRAAGAEAIAINGYRLTATTAIRSAGLAILVDLQPVISPYRIEAIGDSQAMRSSFSASQGAAQLSWLQANYNIKSSVQSASELQLPSGRAASRFVQLSETD